MSDSNNASKMALASLRKRGITFTEHELHIAVLYGMVRSACYALVDGTVSLEEASSRINNAVKKFRELETVPSSDDIVP